MSSRSSETVQNVLSQLFYAKMPLKLKHWGFYIVVLSYISVNGRQDNIQKGTEHVFHIKKVKLQCRLLFLIIAYMLDIHVKL